MPKFTLTIETSDIGDLRALLAVAAGAAVSLSSDPTVNFPDDAADTGDAADIDIEPTMPAAAPAVPKKATGRPPKAKPAEAAPAAKAPAAAPAAKAPAPTGNGPAPEGLISLPSLDALKGAVTTAVRKAQKGEGSTAILDLLGGFKDATGLDYVMNAKEEHKPALVGLLAQAGIPIPV